MTTLLGGLLLYVGQTYVGGWLSTKPAISYSQFAPAFVFDAETVRRWQSTIEGPTENAFGFENGLYAEAIVIENTGEVPIENQNVIVRNRYSQDEQSKIIAFQNDVIPGADGIDTTMRLTDGALRINYRLLSPGEIHRFWIVRDRFTATEVIIRGPNIDVTGWDAKIYRDAEDMDWTKWIIFIAIFLIVMSFLFGMYVQFIENKKIISAHGHDPDEFFKKGAELIKGGAKKANEHNV